VAAPVYYQYGAALYLQAEDASTVFADGVADNGDDVEGDEDEGCSDGGESGDAAVESAVRDTVEANAAVVEDLEIAWEVRQSDV
jgi:hypothetical protein